jgi:hypothetical protein
MSIVCQVILLYPGKTAANKTINTNKKFPLNNRHLNNEGQECKTGHVKEKALARGGG